MVSRSVTIEEIDNLYSMWNGHINVSAPLRSSLREEIGARDVDSDEFRELLEQARKQDYTLDEIEENTNCFTDFQSHVEAQQSQPLAGDAADY
jgi:hypothetical protein